MSRRLYKLLSSLLIMFHERRNQRHCRNHATWASPVSSFPSWAESSIDSMAAQAFLHLTSLLREHCSGEYIRSIDGPVKIEASRAAHWRLNHNARARRKISSSRVTLNTANFQIFEAYNNSIKRFSSRHIECHSLLSLYLKGREYNKLPNLK